MKDGISTVNQSNALALEAVGGGESRARVKCLLYARRGGRGGEHNLLLTILQCARRNGERGAGETQRA